MRKKFILAALTALLLMPAVPMMAYAAEVIFTPTAENCDVFTGWSGGSSLKRQDGITQAPTGGGTATFTVPNTVSGRADIYYYVPEYSAGYTADIDCSANITLKDGNGNEKSFGFVVKQGRGGEWVKLGSAEFSAEAAETVTVTNGQGRHSRLTDVKFFMGEATVFTPTAENCDVFTGWSGGSSLKRQDGVTQAPIGGGTATFTVPDTLSGWVDIYYYIPSYAAGYKEDIDCSANLILTRENGNTETFSVLVKSGKGGEWVKAGSVSVSDAETETLTVTNGEGKHSRLTDVKLVTGGTASYYATASSFSKQGDWLDTSYNGAFDDHLLQSTKGGDHAVLEAEGLEAGEYYVYLHTVDFPYSTGNRNFYLICNDTKYYKAKNTYFGTHLKGTELENSVSESSVASAYFAWEKVTYPSETVTIQADGKLTLELAANTEFARVDGIVFTQDPNFTPNTTLKNGEEIPSVIPYGDQIAYPTAYSGELSAVSDTAVLQNAHTTVSFRRGTTQSGNTMVQRQIQVGETVTVPYADGLGFMSLYASDVRGYQNGGYYGMFQTTYADKDGNAVRLNTQNVFRAGIPEWLIPTTLEQVDANTVRMTADGTYATLTATWTLTETDSEPKVTVTATVKQNGNYSFGFFNKVQETARKDVGYVLNPYRWAESRLPDPGVTITETNSTTDHTQMTYKINELGQEITLGVAVDQSSIALTVPVEGQTLEAGRWPHDTPSYERNKQWDEDKNADGTYNNVVLDYTDENADFVLNTTGMNGGVLPAIFAPSLGGLDSAMQAGQTFTFSYRPLSSVSTAGENRGWYDTYAHVATDLRGVYDYRDNYYSSMTDAAFTVLNLLKDDEQSGWDDNMVGHYNIEDSHWVTNSNVSVYLQNYLLTEDEDLLMERTLPALATLLTRASSHINSRFSIVSRSEGPMNKELDYTTVSVGNATFEGAYLLTRGQMPIFRTLAKSRLMSTGVESAGMSLKNTTDIYWYEHALGSTDYAQTIENADTYLTKRAFISATNIPDLETFINISYSPQFQAQLDAYEITGDSKYLEGAVEGARRFLPSLRITDMPTSKAQLFVEDTEKLVAEDKIFRSSAWSTNDRSYRRGALMEATGSHIAANGAHYDEYTILGYDENYLNSRDNEGVAYPAWVTARTGLGVEQFSTCVEGRNILMSTWAGDLLRLGYLSDDQLMMDLARSSLVGRFANYPGYYYTDYTTLPGQKEYTTGAFDMTSLYFHHIPVFLSAIQDYLFSNAYVKSDGRVDFPTTRTQGYAWFNNRIYGHAAGEIYDEKDMWPWLKEGTITVSSKQIDWIAGRKEGRAAFVLTNAGDTAETVTVTFNAALGIENGAEALLYDREGNTYVATVNNNQTVITVPAKGIMTVAVSGTGIHVPAYSRIVFDETVEETLGETALGLMYEGNTYTKGTDYSVDTGYDVKAYAISASPDSYMGYISVSGRSTELYDYISEKGNAAVGGGDGEDGIVQTTLKWHYEGDTAITTVTDTSFPYEFFIPVTDRSKKIVFTVETQFKNETKKLAREYTIGAPAIVLEDAVDKTNFAPVLLSEIATALGSRTAPLTDGNVKICIANEEATVKKFGGYDITQSDALAGCYLSGYIPVSDNRSTEDVVESGYLLFDNVPILQSRNNAANNRVDFSLVNSFGAVGNENRSDWAVLDANGNYLGVAQGMMDITKQLLIYDMSHVYITNTKNDNSIQVLRQDNKITLRCNGAKYCYVAVVTYDATGKFESISTQKKILSINNDLTLNVQANQKIFVWECEMYKDTNMRPLAEPIVVDYMES